ncbi:tRNA (N6-threonylcarbamoyladenosine(37)-N6)-methyltransferase TrmO [Halomonas sp. EGI 63088]|uniref:tRNA (N6-threonylcarbamoyladenosine(37)-N6)-methyltransferase TrmO n=1 Tax=Halomonas flagellata TaxID=2920385 RepID=A0ABS9RWJ2_9GAMM|nr:tRNA (N6-threonylcarbamoyladenosine(37)-N6)-methyltransferase TrmO [Halomonas flagellata]MCH4564223.1 tRNA (N6-threonylcarbamoyladenosine(37)-N6)-methyltransferase TrmO [Halomonas flagellata]
MIATPTSPAAPGFAMTPIGVIESDYPDKFGIPRQPGLAPAARASLMLTPPFDDPLAVRGLDAFSHLWLTFVFHHSPDRWTPLVRPPRLGGNARVGVFASRSTHRPNRLGLSLVELVEIDTRRGVRLVLGGCDLVSGTPVLDIKPYLPWAEARPEARAGFSPEAPPLLPVTFSPEVEATLAERPDDASLCELIRQVLAQDPRPAYRKGAEERTYGVRLRDVDVRFRAEADPAGDIRLRVVEIVPA